MDRKEAKGIGVHVFVDNTNVFTEGQRASSIRLGKSPRYLDKYYVLDYGKLLYVVMERDTRFLAAIPCMYGSEPPPNDTVWERVRSEGFDLKVFQRNFFGKEKRVDMEMGLDIQKMTWECEKPGICCIVAGDEDYVSVVERLHEAKWKVEVWFWNNASGKLKEAADRFESLNPHIDFIGTRPRKKPSKRKTGKR